ncbi:hypothetical protein [Paractinoplanes ovalisporus]|nr:hypothetical protein [Actinoplanes ovalisporus]
MVVVQWADLTGTGFSPQRRDSDAPAEYWAAAEGLLNADLCQPPDFLRTTGSHPVWTLRKVPVRGHHVWCFAVQGRRGEFGVAGTCRFAFATKELEAAEAWQRGIEATGAQAAEPQMSDTQFAAGVRDVLRGVVLGRDRIGVGLGPAETARIIACVLAALPEAEARAWSWSTCALMPPGPSKRKEVSGRWPDEFRAWEPRWANAIAASFDEPITATENFRRLLEAQRLKGLEEFKEQVVRGQVDADLRRSSRDLAELISRIRTRPSPRPRLMPTVLPPVPATAPSMPVTPAGTNGHQPAPKEDAPEEPPAAESFRFGRDLTRVARDPAAVPIVSRDREIDHILRVISLHKRNNPVLIGEPGAGKTAVIEGLAQRIAAGRVPPALAGKLLYGVDRGVAPDELIVEIAGQKDVIVVVEDYFHWREMYRLLRNDVQIIATSTAADYESARATDRSLDRSFTPVLIAVPTAAASVAILQAVRPSYERHHRLRIADDALTEAVRLAARHIGDRSLPSTALDLLDDAAAWLAVHNPESVLEAAAVWAALDRHTGHGLAVPTLADAPATNLFKDGGRDVWMMS